jgi:hypothetical protein
MEGSRRFRFPLRKVSSSVIEDLSGKILAILYLSPSPARDSLKTMAVIEWEAQRLKKGKTMNTLLTVFTYTALVLALALAGSAFAKPLAFVKQSGGFCRTQCQSTVITIHDTGDVVAETETMQPSSKVTKATIAQLSAAVIRAIKRDIELATAVPLVDSKPSAPLCADLPSKSYNILKANQTIEIGAEKDCHDYLLESYEATGIVSTLKGLVILNNYSK